MGLLGVVRQVDGYPQADFGLALVPGRLPGGAIFVDGGLQLGQRKHPRGVDQDVETHSPQNRETLSGGNAHPDGRVRLLVGLGAHRHLGEGEVLAFEREAVGGPGLEDDLDAFFETAPALLERHAEPLVHVGESTPADTEFHAAVADLVQGRDLLGDTDRVGQRQQQHGRSHTDVLRASGDGGQDGYGAGKYPCGVEMILGHPNGGHSQVLGLVDESKGFLEGFVFVGTFPYGELQEQSEFHDNLRSQARSAFTRQAGG